MQKTYFNFCQIFHQYVNFPMHFSTYYKQSEFFHHDDFFVSPILFWAPWKVSYATDVHQKVI